MSLLSVRLCLYLVICVTCVTAICQIHDNQAVCHLRDVWYNQGVQWHKLTLVNLRKADQRFFGKWIFRNNPQLTQLVIEKSVDFGVANMFQNFRVEHISYSNNILPVVPANMFSDCTVKQLALNNNHIKILQPGCFKNLPSLRHLSIQGNHIQMLRKWVFNKLSVTELRLSNNEIPIIRPGTFFNMYSLTNLYLDHNHLHTFSSKFLLGRGCNLELLDLSYNSISKVNKPMLDFLTNLRALNLANNKIAVIQHGAFQQLSQIRTINLQRNYLRLISCFVFPPYGLYHLDEFNIGGNNIRYLSRQLLDRLRTVKNICMGQNPLQCSTQNAVLQWTIQNDIYCSDTMYNLVRKSCGYSFPHVEHIHHHYHHHYPCPDAGCTNTNDQGDYKHLIDIRFGLKETIQNSSQEILTSEESDRFGASNLTSLNLDDSTSFEVDDTSAESHYVPVLLNRFSEDKEEEFDYDDLLQNYINNTFYESDDIYNSTANYEQNLTNTENTFNVYDSLLNVSETLMQNVTEYVTGNYEQKFTTTENVFNASDFMLNVTETLTQNVTEYVSYDNSTEEYLELTSKTTEQVPTTTEKNNVEDEIPVIRLGFGFDEE